jgi:signal peptidase I
MRSSQTKKLISSALGLIVLGSLWFWFAPSQFGGSTTYVVTHGISMEPRFHTGDLALVRAQGSYHVGEIVAYDSKMLHTIVLHRIIGRDGSRYVFKGDNNNFVDPEHPRASQLIGALWLHIPGAGATLLSIRSPLLLGALIAVGMLILTGSVFARRRRLRRRTRRSGVGAQARSAHPPRPAGTPAAGILAVGLLLLLPFLALTLVAFTRSPMAHNRYTIPYRQSGALTYTAQAPPGPAYPEGKVATGEPIFAHIVKAIDFSFAYRLQAAGRRTLGGMLALDAKVTSTYGWQRTLALAPPTPFRGSHGEVSGTLELASLFALMRSVEKTTAATGGYTLTILPKVRAAGTVDGLPIHAQLTSTAAFTLTPMEIRSASASSGASASAAVEEQPADPLTSSTSGTATGTHTAPATLTFGVATLSVEEARKVALLAVAAILILVLLLLCFLRPLQARLDMMRPREEAEQIRAKFGRFIIPVERVWQLPGVPVIDVADIGALAQIAENYERSILYEVSEESEAYWVTDESGQFRYALGAPAAAWEREGEGERAPAASTQGAYGGPAPETHGYPATATHPDPTPTAQGSLAHDWHTEELDLNGLIDRGRPATA